MLLHACACLQAQLELTFSAHQPSMKKNIEGTKRQSTLVRLCEHVSEVPPVTEIANMGKKVHLCSVEPPRPATNRVCTQPEHLQAANLLALSQRGGIACAVCFVWKSSERCGGLSLRGGPVRRVSGSHCIADRRPQSPQPRMSRAPG